MTEKKFLWGSATAAYQCEGAWQDGGKGPSNWDVFCHSEANNVNPVTGDIACDHYHRYEEDIKRMADGGQNAYRFSIAWTRVIPDGTGEKSQEGIDFYNRLIDTCLKYGIEPLVTLYHYDLPQPIFERGGWENRDTVDAYVQYAKVCFEAFGDRVNYWATINEPNYETLCCYGYGNYPPNIQSLERRWKAMYHMMLASAKAVGLYRSMGGKGMIGLVSDCYSIDYMGDGEEYRKAARFADLFFNISVNDVCVKGAYPKEYTDKLTEEGYDLSYMRKEDREIFKAGCVDYLGVNAYCRFLVKPCTEKGTSLTVNNTGDGKKKELFIEGWFALDEDKGLEKTPWGMEIYPKSIYDLLLGLRKRYPALPVVITENGVGNYDSVCGDGKVHDQYRIDYLKGYVDWIEKAMDAGCDVRGYFVWSSMDVYSWINGYKKRYGLVYVDFDDEGLKRIPKDSYYWYKNTIRDKGEKFDGKVQ
ncbi:glycoside hydrolase family 1 protein [Lachnospiraceae bacterium]|nr:glycoside hydrolase family 1 protein [Lachnospiraceae bacterium]